MFPDLVARAASASTSIDQWLLRSIASQIAPARLRLALWNGFETGPDAGAAIARIVINSRRALLGCAWDPELSFGDAYMFGDVDVEGDLIAVMEEIYRSLPLRPRPWWLPTRSNPIDAARANVHRHYDLGNSFYRLWLDREMVYTCAYFPAADASLEEAQIAKMDLVCRKLRLEPGHRVVEAGCGWGGLALHMARRYRVSVRAFNVSSEQIAYARERARAESLDDRVELLEDDYRNVTGRYDRFVSVGMLEHVGLADYATFGHVIDRSLLSDGCGLLHFIGRTRPAPLNAWIRKRIFPGAYPPTLAEVFERVLGPVNLSVLHLENLRLHYARTLEHWYARFDQENAAVRSMFDQAFVRAWRLYFAGARAAFTTGSMQLFQIVFARGGSNVVGLARVDG